MYLYQSAILWLLFISNGEGVRLLRRTVGVERHVHPLIFGATPPPSPPSLFEPFGRFHQVVAERRAHKGVEDGVDAAVCEGQALGHLSRLVHDFTGAAVGH